MENAVIAFGSSILIGAIFLGSYGGKARGSVFGLRSGTLVFYWQCRWA